MTPPDLSALAEGLESWAFNLMLECSGHPEKRIEVLVGGAVLDLRELSDLLSALRAHLTKEKNDADQ